MAESDDDNPLSEQEEWNVGLVGMNFHVIKSLLQKLIDVGLFSAEEAQTLMFEAAEAMRDGADKAKVETVAYYLSKQMEKLGNDLVGQKEEDQ